ncbi:MAG TPA: hypothetical protein VFK56_02725, partial [Mycobacterium sp.]|nr:hypothetical protein [Mycobacterium sp.]
MTLLLKRSAIALLATTALAACVSEMPRFPIEPGPTAFQPAFTQVAVKPEARGQAKSNRVKYRDTGLKPGRAAGGLIEARALRGSDGMTTIEATTGTFDEGPAMARIERIQVRVLNSGLPTYNERPQSRFWSRTMPHLAVGDQVELT